MHTCLEMAKTIADAACCLDWGKSNVDFTPKILAEIRADMAILSIKLHDIATQLAGDQVHEVYGPDEEEQLTITQAAGLGGVSIDEGAI